MSENYAGGLSSWRSPKTVLALVIVAALTAVVILSILRDRIVNQPQWQVQVIGQSRVAYQPDTAKVTLGVQIDKAAQAETALQQLDEKMAKIYTAVVAAGVPAENIATQNYSLSPQYDYLENVSSLSGYTANQMITVKIKDIKNNQDKVSAVVSAATKAGANQVQGIVFEASNLNELKQTARLQAIADAKSKSRILAKAAGVHLGKVVGWWENLVYSPETNNYGYYDGKGGAGGSPTVPAGDQEIIMEVNVSYQVK